MLLKNDLEILDARKLTPNIDIADIEVLSACGSDLMSDVLAFVKDQTLLLTGLINPQVIRTAEMMDIRAIIFVRGKVPEEGTISLAEDKNIPLFTTNHPLYVACGMLYSRGLVGKGGK